MRPTTLLDNLTCKQSRVKTLMQTHGLDIQRPLAMHTHGLNSLLVQTHARMNKDAFKLQEKTHSSLDKLIYQLTAKQPHNANSQARQNYHAKASKKEKKMMAK